MLALDPPAIERMIGRPDFVRHDSGATVWQYAGRSCVMDLFWYGSGNGRTLVHLEARSLHGPRGADIGVCLDELWKQHALEAES